ncbi:unnamed protein product [Diamesa serratosioi]
MYLDMGLRIVALQVFCCVTISGNIFKEIEHPNEEFFKALNCAFYEMGFSYMCEVKNITITNKRTFINVVNGEHDYQRTDLNVIDLDVTNENTKYLPLNIFQIFVNLQVLTVSNSSLEFIDNNSFYDADNLKQLYLDHNNIVAIPHDTFYGLFKLRYLSLSYNKIVTLSSEHLVDLTSLFFFNISNNKFQKLDNNLLKHNKQLDWIFIDYGVLQLIKKTTRGYNEQLSWAIFEDNFCIDYKKLTTELDLTIDKIGAYKCEDLIES